MITKGGPIILYQIENEYNYFEQSIAGTKLATLNGKPEVPSNYTVDTYDMFKKLKQIVKSQGIDIPLTHCPGTTELTGMGGIEEVLPLPNYYATWKTVEETSYKYKQFQSKLALYHQYPSGISETFRSASMLSRFIISGMDLVSNFNAFGMYQQGHHNSMILQFPGVMSPSDIPRLLKQTFKFTDPRDIVSGFVRPPMALFPSVVDYNGAVSPSGQLREKFFQLRRLNLFYDSFEHIIALGNHPFRSITGKPSKIQINLKNENVHVSNPKVGSLDKDAKGNRVIYWLPLKNEVALIGLLNDGKQQDEIIMKKHSIHAYGYTFPNKQYFILPKEESRTLELNDGSVNGNAEGYYLMHIVINWPLLNDIKIDYSTAEVLLFDTYGDSSVLMLFNKENSPCEFQLSGLNKFSVSNTTDVGFKSSNSVLFYCRIPAVNETPLVYKIKTEGRLLTVIVMGRYMSGRTWHLGHLDYLIGVDYYSPFTKQISFINNNNQFYYYGDSNIIKNCHLIDKQDLMHQYQLPYKPVKLIEIDFSQLMGQVVVDDYTQISNYTLVKTPLPSAESMGYYDDYIQYKTEFKLSKLQAISFVVDYAADFATIFVNGHFITALCPLGTKIESNSWNHQYRFKIPKSVLKIGLNKLHIKVDIWGRGNFMFPRGSLGRIPLFGHLVPTGIHVRDPVVGFDSVKGLIGNAFINKQKITTFEVAGGNLYTAQTLPIASNVQKLPIRVEPGQIKWISYTVPKMEYSEHKMPMSLKLVGSMVKVNIFINDVLIGRWISDDDVINKGNYFNVDKKAWSLINVDHFPIEDYKTGLKIVLQVDSKGNGVLESMKISLAQEIILTHGETVGQVERKYNIFK